MKIKLIKRYLLLSIGVIVLNSCLGVSADITIKADGSGKIDLVYRVSQALESLGRLDGNEKMPAVPVGKADFERTVSRIHGLRLSHYSLKDIKKDTRSDSRSDLVTNVTLEFRDTSALLAFLDSSGSRATLVQEGQGSLLRLTLLEPSDGISNPDLLSLLREVSGNYELDITLNLPRNAALTTIPASIPAARLVSNGKKVSFSIGMEELLNLKDGAALEIRW